MKITPAPKKAACNEEGKGYSQTDCCHYGCRHLDLLLELIVPEKPGCSTCTSTQEEKGAPLSCHGGGFPNKPTLEGAKAGLTASVLLSNQKSKLSYRNPLFLLPFIIIGHTLQGI
eukprot:1153873-Pelagomonas_calceolata.AAC.4